MATGSYSTCVFFLLPFLFFLNVCNLLFLDLSRFIPGSYYFRKDSSSVSIPSVLGMDEMREIRRNLTDEAKEVFDFPKYKYELTAVVNHSGSMAGGHYTWFDILFFNLISLFLICFFFLTFSDFRIYSTSRLDNGKWYNYSDSFVSSASQPSTFSEAYILFYSLSP